MFVDTDVKVIVVGAGPVGLTLAAELALAGVRVQVLERRTVPDPAMRAQSINVPTAEALDRRGLLPALEQIQRETPGVFGPRFTGHFAGMPLDPALVDWADPELAVHSAVDGARMIPQPRLEALLAAHAERLGVEVRRGVAVTALEDTGAGVVVGTDSGPLHAGWVVGCDGGHSTVRRLAGIPFPGTDPEITGYQAVVDIADPEKLADGWSWSPHGVYRYGPQPGRVATVEFDGGPADRTAPVTLADVQSSLRRVSGTDVTLTGLRATPTRWTDNTRQAAAYRAGRVLLAGDAAHVHPPFGGQGLNLGIGDAVNLGWKLAAVASGRSPESLLDTYDTERRPVGAWVLDWTRAQIGILRGDPKSGALRGVVADLLATRDGTTYAVKQIAGVTQRTPLPGAHRWTGRYVPDVPLSDGSRLADHAHEGGFLLLDRTPRAVFAGRAAGRARVVGDGDAGGLGAVGGDDGAEVMGALVRPDGVVAWATDTADPDGLTEALTRWAGGGSP
ncbi:FAD-dependent monooxygenase [Streptomyces sp. NPDC048241]|uniref:FAD-dependent monooxygenase n=1 Tax=Streptomyces sp. NPDC048241 TaxID=3365521 RepID=UPI00371DD18D